MQENKITANCAINNKHLPELDWSSYNDFVYGYTGKTLETIPTIPVKNIPKATDLPFNKKERTYIIYDMKILEDISSICLPKANASEFQIHYEALIFQIWNVLEEKRVNIVIPTCFYNFKQEVSGASVDFECKDITEAYNAIADTVDITSLQPIIDLIHRYNAFNNAGYSSIITRGDFGSIHRHPSKMTFSATDLKNDPENPGIIYRKTEFDGVQTDSIIYISNSKAENTELFHSEARRVNIKKAENNGCTGTYQEHTTINVLYRKDNWILENDNVDFNDILNLQINPNLVKEEEEKSREHYFYTDIEEEQNMLLDKVMQLYHESNFTPDISTINAEHITQKAFYTTYKGYNAGLYSSEEYNDSVLIHIYNKDTNEHINTVEAEALIEIPWYDNEIPKVSISYDYNGYKPELRFTQYNEYSVITNADIHPWLPKEFQNVKLLLDIEDVKAEYKMRKQKSLNDTKLLQSNTNSDNVTISNLYIDPELKAKYPNYKDEFMLEALFLHSDTELANTLDLDQCNINNRLVNLKVSYSYDNETNEFYVEDIHLYDIFDTTYQKMEKIILDDGKSKLYTHLDYKILFEGGLDTLRIFLEKYTDILDDNYYDFLDY